MKRNLRPLILPALIASQSYAFAQDFDITTFDTSSKGDWSNPAKTTLVVPKIPNGSAKLDGTITAAEYGGFQKVTVTPGINAWILDFPGDRVWDNAADSSFDFWLAHDDENFYVAVKASDDIINSDDTNGNFWKDDAIEIVVDALSDRFDNNTDSSKDKFGGHSYVNYLGKFSRWDDENSVISGDTWSTGVEWKYGPNEDIFGSGKQVEGGWAMEVRFKKRLFEDPVAGNKLRNGYRMGFNIGLDDDDKQGPGTGGNGARTQDLEIQYFWANRERRQGLNQDFLDSLSQEDRDAKFYLYNSDLPLVLDSTGRLSHGGSGEIIFGYDTPATGKILFVTSSADNPLNADPALIALFRARGYTVNVFTSGAPAEDFIAAAQANDLVFISETIGSTSVIEGGSGTGKFILRDIDVPVISNEAFMYDNADWVKRTEDGSNDFVNWGNTGRSEVDAIGLGDARNSLYIRKADHPIAKGLAAGKVQVYDGLYSFNFGIPSADADVIASVEAVGSYPALFVYEKGDKLTDGSVVPNKRIGLFLGQAANPTTNWGTPYSIMNEAGRTLLLNTIEYAIGKAVTVPPSISIARSGDNVVVTYAGGTLEGADSLTGTWSTVSSPSPATLPAATGAKFFRVKGN